MSDFLGPRLKLLAVLLAAQQALLLLLLCADPISSFASVVPHLREMVAPVSSRRRIHFSLHSSSLPLEEDKNGTDDDGSSSSTAASILLLANAGVRRFLGRGPRALVREGSVLVAPQHEYHHYYRQAAIFIYDIGLNDDVDTEPAAAAAPNQDNNDADYVIRGLILDHPTPFSWKEMIPDKFDNNPLGDNLLFRGGDKGGDGVILLHNRPELGQTDIGGSGIYQGGWDAAVAAVEAGDANVEDFKAFFNYCEFSESELESLLESEEGGDSWASVEVDNDIVLSEDWDRGDCWKRIRNAISQQMQA